MNLDSLSQELDRLYEFEISEYIARCDELKKSGYRIYRNSNGIHKVVLGGQQSQSSRAQSQDQYQYANESIEPKKENIFVRAKKAISKGIQGFKSFVGFVKFLYRIYKNGKQF